MSDPCEQALVFVFEGLERNWRPASAKPGHQGRVFVYRSLPGNVVAWGQTQDEAVERLKSALYLSMSTCESPKEWYDRARAKMTAEEATKAVAALGSMWSTTDATFQALKFGACRVVTVEMAPVLTTQPGTWPQLQAALA